MDERPSGWYDDPDEPTRLRYWDGTSWTDRTHEKAPMPAPQPRKAPVTRLRPGRPEEQEEASAQASREAPVDADDRAARENGESSPRPWSTDTERRRAPHGREEPPALDTRPAAGVGRRFLALAVDLFLVTFVVMLITVPFLGDVIAASNAWFASAVAAVEAGGTVPDPPAAVQAASTTLSVIFGVSLVLYEVLFLSRWGATPGRWLTRTRVRPNDAEGSATLDLGPLLRRSVVKYAWVLLSGVALLALAAWVFFVIDSTRALTNPRRETLHEKWSSTHSVRASGTKGPQTS